MDGTYIKFTVVEEYINALNVIFEHCYQSQDDVARSYNNAIENWNDEISDAARLILLEIERSVTLICDEISHSLKVLNRRCQTLSEGYAERSWNAAFIKREQQIKLKRESSMEKDTINGTTAEGIRAFERALDVYIQNTTDTVAEIRREHEAVHAGWHDSQYERTTERIYEFTSTILKQLDCLKDLQTWIAERRRYFEEAMSIHD